MRTKLALLATLLACLAIGAGALADPDNAPPGFPAAQLVPRPEWIGNAAQHAPSESKTSTAAARLGLAPVPPGSKLPGYLLIADRDNNRLIVVSPSKHVVWRFPHPAAGGVRHQGSLSQPDDAFVSSDGRFISTNQEFAETIKVIRLSTRPRVVWAYGHSESQGSAPGYLAHPDDAYLVPGHLIQVADIVNCRVLWIDRHRRIVRAIGHAGECAHDPPRTLADPNGDTPTPDGGMLVTEIGGWVDRLDRLGRLRWSIRTPTTYPSDAQLLPGGNVLVASYTSPGRVDIITPRGHTVWTYEFATGRRALDHPSLAVALPNGDIVLNDDFNDRVVVINRATKRIVWQYGHDGVRGSRQGYLANPDGLELLPYQAIPPLF